MKKEVAKAYAYLAMVRSDINQETALLIANEFDKCIRRRSFESFARCLSGGRSI